MVINKFFKITTLTLISLVVAGLITALSYAAEESKKEPVKEIVIIVNPSAKIKNITLKDLKRIYECKKKTLEGVGKLALLNLPKENPTRIAFSKIVLKKTAEEMERFYLKMALSGKGQPPKVVKTEKKMLEFVKKNKRAMGYIRAGIEIKGVKAITVDKKKTVKEKEDEKK
jgi:ABC-type phosphate transport system substrate-binding protein